MNLLFKAPGVVCRRGHKYVELDTAYKLYELCREVHIELCLVVCQDGVLVMDKDF